MDEFGQGNTSEKNEMRTILTMEDNEICKRILVTRSKEFCENMEVCMTNEFSSPIFNILNTSIQVDMFE